MNSAMFMKYFKGMCSGIKEPSLIIMDNARYHFGSELEGGLSKLRKAELQAWLSLHGVKWEEDWTKAELYTLARTSAPARSTIANIAREYNHEVLFLPPYHPDLNPVET
jgi:hypothetical protein